MDQSKNYYFKHHNNSAFSLNIAKFIKTMGYEGYGIYWALLEYMHYNYILKLSEADLPIVARILNVAPDLLLGIVRQAVANKMLKKQRNQFTSSIISESLDDIYSASERARNAAAKRWKRHPGNAPSNADGNAKGNANNIISEKNKIENTHGISNSEEKEGESESNLMLGLKNKYSQLVNQAMPGILESTILRLLRGEFKHISSNVSHEAMSRAIEDNFEEFTMSYERRTGTNFLKFLLTKLSLPAESPSSHSGELPKVKHQWFEDLSDESVFRCSNTNSCYMKMGNYLYKIPSEAYSSGIENYRLRSEFEIMPLHSLQHVSPMPSSIRILYDE